MSLLEHIQTKMKPVPGKATLADLVLAKNEIPEALTGNLDNMPAVPDCITEILEITEDGVVRAELRPERILILTWIQLRQEKPDISKEEVASIVSLADVEAMQELIKEINWFWSDLSRDEFERRWTLRMEQVELDMQLTPVEDGDSAEVAEVASENPTASENS